VDVPFYFSDLAYRHLGYANILYADGHVDTFWYDTLVSFDHAIRLPNGGAFMLALELRITGVPENGIRASLLEEGSVLNYGYSVLRKTGSPDEENVEIHIGPCVADPWKRRYSLRLELFTAREGDAKPIWVKVNGYNVKLGTLNSNKNCVETDVTELLRIILSDRVEAENVKPGKGGSR
jgi:prepilin-type processing-associated H-X9-DG protein